MERGGGADYPGGKGGIVQVKGGGGSRWKGGWGYPGRKGGIVQVEGVKGRLSRWKGRDCPGKRVGGGGEIIQVESGELSGGKGG